MRWLPVLLSIALAAVVSLGVASPSLAFALLPFLAAFVLAWVLFEGIKELKRVGAIRLDQTGPIQGTFPAGIAVEARGTLKPHASATGNSQNESKGGYSAVA